MKRILVVDDEPDFRRILGRVFEPPGFQVSFAPSAEDALKRLKAERPDVMIIDWNLPGMTGVDLCRKLRSDARFKTLPLVMLTVRGCTEDQLQGLNLGQADVFLTKPVPPEELLARVGRLLERGEADANA